MTEPQVNLLFPTTELRPPEESLTLSTNHSTVGIGNFKKTKGLLLWIINSPNIHQLLLSHIRQILGKHIFIRILVKEPKKIKNCQTTPSSMKMLCTPDGVS